MVHPLKKKQSLLLTLKITLSVHLTFVSVTSKKKEQRFMKPKQDRSTRKFFYLINDQTNDYHRFGAENAADVVLARGAGEFYHDWDDENVINRISERYICDHHRGELLYNWNTKMHVKKSTKRGSEGDACTFPETLGYKHQKLTMLNNLPLLHNDAKALLYITGTLVHEGIPVCKNHQAYVRDTATSFNAMQRNRILFPQPITGNLADSEHLEKDAELSRAQCNIHDKPRESRCKNINYHESPEKKKPKLEPDTPKKERFYCVPRAEPYNENAKQHFKSLLTELKIEPITATKQWNAMSVRSQTRHVSAFKETVNKIAELAVGVSDAPNLILASNILSTTKPIGYFNNQAEQAYLVELSKLYYSVDSNVERRNVLAMVADYYPIGMLQNVIPGLTFHAYYEAKKAAIRQKNKQVKLNMKTPKPRVELADITSFVGFIASELITTGLPFGNTPKTLPGGRIVEVPSAVRNFRASEIIRMYRNEMEKRELNVKISESTMRRILEACPAKTRTTLDAVDQFKANGFQAFEWMKDLVETLFTLDIVDSATSDAYKSQLTEAEFFLKADYYNLLESEHLSADLCLNYALSDKRIKQFRSSKCRDPSKHLYRIQRAYIFDNLLTNINIDISDYAIKNKANEGTTKVMQKLEATIKESELAVHRWRNHIVRKRFSDDARADIIKNLRNGEAFITFDYAQKWLPRKSREPMRDYFGKAGLSMHVMHAVFKECGEPVHHTIVHFLGHAEQDYVAVTAILINGLQVLAERGVKNVILRSDNAAYYHNALLLISMPWIGEKAGVNILRYSFSEAQAGKSTADVETARLKNVLRAYLNAGNNILNEHDMFNAIDNAIKLKGLHGVTAVVPEIIPVKTAKIEKQLDYLYFIGDIEYSKHVDGYSMRYWKHYQVGDGFHRVLTAEDKIGLPISPFGGDPKYSTQTLPFWRAANMHRKPSNRNDRNCNEEIDNSNAENNPTTTAMTPVTLSGCHTSSITTDHEGLYQCSYEGCTREFIKQENLEAHMLKGKHTLVADAETLQETSYKLYADIMLGLHDARLQYISVTTSTKDLEVRSDKEVKSEGWALKESVKRARFTDEVKKFLRQRFVAHMQQGRKRVNANTIQDEMRNSDKPFFTAEERLNAAQIASWYSRYAAELNKLLRSVQRQEMEKDYEDAIDLTEEAAVDEAGFEQEYRTNPEFRQPDDELLDTLSNDNEYVEAYQEERTSQRNANDGDAEPTMNHGHDELF